MGEGIRFSSNGGTCEAYLARPVAARAPGVLVIQEWWGLNDNIKRIADAFAGDGFLALAPDLYHGKRTKSPDEAGKLLMAMSVDLAGKDLLGGIAHLKALSRAPVGVVGFCMGGALSLYAACLAGEDVGACVVYYGGHPKLSYAFDGLRAPVLGHWAEHDDFANAGISLLERELQKRGGRYEFHHYPGTRHAFFNEDRPQVYDGAASRLSFARTLAFFREHLGPRGGKQ
jgi:carboxymethylenebutenolidase